MSATPSRKKSPLNPSVSAVLQRQVARGALQPDLAQTQVARALDHLQERLVKSYEGRRFFSFRKERDEKLRGIYLWGSPGSGKSMLMDMFVESIAASSALASMTRRRTHFLPFMQAMHADIDRLNRSAVRDPLARLARRVAKESRLLCFDELVVEDIADAMLLGRLFAKLVQHEVVLVATSNFAPDDLYKDGFKRDNFLPFLKLLREAVVSKQVCSGADYRSLALAKQGKDLWFRGKKGEKRMSETFVRFVEVGGKQQSENQLGNQLENQFENQFLACEGRPILLIRTGVPSDKLRAKGVSKNVVWCSFADLCQRARGVRDYNVLLGCCDVLLLAEFPVLDEGQRNAAKRFMRLVDLFYERRAIVLCHSVAASPRALYGGESHAKEFKRTASRLEEMLARAHALL